MKVTINGKIEELPAGMTIRQYLDQREINFNTVACELNLQVLKRKELSAIQLKEGDTLEIIRMIGGG